MLLLEFDAQKWIDDCKGGAETCRCCCFFMVINHLRPFHLKKVRNSVVISQDVIWKKWAAEGLLATDDQRQQGHTWCRHYLSSLPTLP